MNIGYFRKTEKSFDEAVVAAKGAFAKRKIQITGEKKLPSGSVLLQFLDVKKTDAVLEGDRMLLGLIPTALLIEKKDGAVSVGIVNPQLLTGTPHFDAIEGTVNEFIKEMREVVHESAGVSEPKVQEIKLYSTATCPYCKLEKAYLEKNNVKFDLVMVDADRAAAEDMIRKSGQTGVPQTEVIYDDGDSEIIMGFDKSRLSELLHIEK